MTSERTRGRAGGGNVPAYTERGAGEAAIVMLHGVGGGKEVWPWQLDAFAARGYRSAAWDMPGYGESPPIHPYTMSELARSLARLLEALDARQTIVLGHSMGGMVAQELIALAPTRVQGLILSGTSPAFGRPDGAWQRQFLESRLAPLDAGKTMPELAAMLVRDMVGIAPDEKGLHLAVEAMGRVPAATYRNALQALMGFDLRGGLAAIEVPTLVLAGEQDSNAPPQVMQRMAEKIPGAQYECLTGVGHLANMEQPRRFNAAVLGFLEQHFPVRHAAGRT